MMSCAKDNIADLQKTNGKQLPIANCDTNNVSFASKIIPIMETKCGSKNNACHTQSAQSGGVYLDSHQGVVNSQGKNLLNSIKWEGFASRMPKNSAKLDDCSIAIIDTWIKQGSKNN